MISKKNMKNTTFPKIGGHPFDPFKLVHLDKLMLFLHLEKNCRWFTWKLFIKFRWVLKWLWVGDGPIFFKGWFSFAKMARIQDSPRCLPQSKQTNSPVCHFSKNRHILNPRGIWTRFVPWVVPTNKQQRQKFSKSNSKRYLIFLGNLSLFGFRNWDGLPTKSLERLTLT